MIGEVVGNFRLVAKIGRGGMGDVFLGEHASAGTRVAIKVLKADLSADAEYVQRLFNEARAVDRIRHPGVVQVFDVGVDGKGRAYLVMELLQGETLGRTLVTSRLTLDQVLSIARQIALILEATHAVGITHRDLKPENIFLVVDREVAGGLRVKVLDFGIAKLTGSLKSGFPTTQVSLGTPAYMAPEQWGDPSRIDGRVDLYALGCVLFEMACGKPPFPASTMAEACAAHVGQTPPRARSLVPHLPAALDHLIDRLLAKSADVRALPREVVQVCDGIARGSAPTMSGTPAGHDARMTQPTGFPGRAPTAPVSPDRAGEGIPTAQPSSPPPPPPPPPPPAFDMRETAPQLFGPGAPSPARRPTLLILVGGLALVAGGTTVVVVASRGRPADAPAGADGKVDLRAGRADRADAGAASSQPSARMREAIDAIATSNAWTERSGVPTLAHLVTQQEYAQYIAGLPTADQPQASPLYGFDPGATSPVRWVTWEQADAFCKTIGGKLLTSERWETLVGTDAEGRLKFGEGVREWTSSRTNDGRRIVRGAFAEMQPDLLEAERPWLFRWHTEASAGGRDPIERVASTEISFRCTK